MFGGRQQRGEFPRDTAERLLRDEVSTAIDPSNLHSLLYGVVRSKYRKLAPQDGGAQYFLCHYCMPVSSAMVAEKQSKLDPKEYDLEHGIQEYDRARLAAFDPEGPYGFNRMILLEEYDRIFGTS